jgi:hypothetical protein
MNEVYGFQKEGSFVVMAPPMHDEAMTFFPSLLNSELARERTRLAGRRTMRPRLVRPAAPDPRDAAAGGGPHRGAADR